MLVPTLHIWRAFSIMARSFSSDSKEVAGLPGAENFFSFNFEMATGSKFKKTSLCKNTNHMIKLRLLKHLMHDRLKDYLKKGCKQ